ncbi:Alpha/Beta hydrolase protein [Macrophomina phaseolina]|uniref:Alpha/Beta hydrolase protein n=1 Tax=Macrophomina phaseolina TaxID=35725 RepID=A0ABQ8GPT8_9PEZI|nr:Alpha/Beta hydrolase protein [Macrophomina phaseolina]
MLRPSFACLTIAFFAFHSASAAVGVSVNTSASDALPILTLPYARVQAKTYDAINDLYTFKNIPFAAPPTGSLRWREPQPPLTNTSLIDGSHGPSCIQTGIGDPDNIQGISGPSSEDCLYLDAYVPGAALRSNTTSPLPVLHWFHGGGYVYGSKDLYGGGPLLQTANNTLIYIASNYRLGAYGFLAGASMERDGLPNAGFWDQRAALNWTATYAALLGGDPRSVTAFGESAGAGSILHHITAFGGAQDPLFGRAILQSPAFDFRWDRAGAAEQQFRNFSAAAGCAGGGVECLRSASAAALQTANDEGARTPYAERSAYEPTADGGFVRQMAPLELRAGRFWQRLESVVLSHVRDEASPFVDRRVRTDEDFGRYVEYYFPVDGVPQLIARQYPAVASGNATYAAESDRLRDMLAGNRFVCNIRYLADALAPRTKVWNLQYSAPPGTHGADVLPSFFFPSLIGPNATAAFVDGYRSLLTSLARAGDPNTFKRNNSVPSIPDWPQVDNSTSEFGNVLDVDLFSIDLIKDPQNSQPICDFWIQIAAAVTNVDGYAPPGSAVAQGLLPESGDSSRNFGKCCRYCFLAGG